MIVPSGLLLRVFASMTAVHRAPYNFFDCLASNSAAGAAANNADSDTAQNCTPVFWLTICLLVVQCRRAVCETHSINCVVAQGAGSRSSRCKWGAASTATFNGAAYDSVFLL